MKIRKNHLLLHSAHILGILLLSAQAYAQNSEVSMFGTRSWIRIDLADGMNRNSGTKIHWTKNEKKPIKGSLELESGKNRYYIQQVEPETNYTVWVESATGKTLAKRKVYTSKNWKLDDRELSELQHNPSSQAVPIGMEVYWQDEFNDQLLNRNKWTTNYFSSLNYLNTKSRSEMLNNQLPQPAYTMDGSVINLYVNDSIPNRIFTEGGNQKISSIQTYDWQTNENLLDNSSGGYFEVKVRRNMKGKPKGLNTAFWFDSPGPDIRYYLQEGGEVDGIKGIRPKGQLFEIDVFEYVNAQFVIHGHVDPKGVFQHNLATHIAEGYEHIGQWVTHGVLWTPTSIKHFINGNLIKEYNNKNEIYSPNHFMNVFLGAYGSNGDVNMEVDYIRAYNWPLKEGNLLPNPDFEGEGGANPWEGELQIAPGGGEKNSNAAVLSPGKKMEQYVYFDPKQHFELSYWMKGGSIQMEIDEVTPVTGVLKSLVKQASDPAIKEKKYKLGFRTGIERQSNKKIIRIAFENLGNEPTNLDNITIVKKETL